MSRSTPSTARTSSNVLTSPRSETAGPSERGPDADADAGDREDDGVVALDTLLVLDRSTG